MVLKSRQFRQKLKFGLKCNISPKIEIWVNILVKNVKIIKKLKFGLKNQNFVKRLKFGLKWKI